MRATEGGEAFEVARSGSCTDSLVSKGGEIELYLDGKALVYHLRQAS
jgi:hypothetical protein